MDKGFYKQHPAGYLLYAAEAVTAREYAFRKEDLPGLTLPIDGWRWFDSLEEACVFFQVDINEYREQEPDDAA
jgi:hypothetical protein